MVGSSKEPRGAVSREHSWTAIELTIVGSQVVAMRITTGVVPGDWRYDSLRRVGSAFGWPSIPRIDDFFAAHVDGRLVEDGFENAHAGLRTRKLGVCLRVCAMFEDKGKLALILPSCSPCNSR